MVFLLSFIVLKKNICTFAALGLFACQSAYRLSWFSQPFGG
jgi:hypothetical protein